MHFCSNATCCGHVDSDMCKFVPRTRVLTAEQEDAINHVCEVLSDVVPYLDQHNYTADHKRYVVIADPDRDAIRCLDVSEIEAFLEAIKSLNTKEQP